METTVTTSRHISHTKIAAITVVLGAILILGLKFFAERMDDDFVRETSDAEDILAILNIGIASEVAPAPLCTAKITKLTRDLGYAVRCGRAGSVDTLLSSMENGEMGLAIVPLKQYLATGVKKGFPATIIAVLSKERDRQINILVADRNFTQDHHAGMMALLQTYFDALPASGQGGFYTLSDNIEQWFGISDNGQDQIIMAIDRELKVLQQEYGAKLPKDNNLYRLTNRDFIQMLAVSRRGVQKIHTVTKTPAVFKQRDERELTGVIPEQMVRTVLPAEYQVIINIMESNFIRGAAILGLFLAIHQLFARYVLSPFILSMVSIFIVFSLPDIIRAIFSVTVPY